MHGMTDPYAPISGGRTLTDWTGGSGSRFGLDEGTAGEARGRTGSRRAGWVVPHQGEDAPGAAGESSAQTDGQTAGSPADEPAGARAVRSTRAGLVMASGTVASRVLGLVRTVALAMAIGATGHISDIWDLANVLPNQIYGMIAGGVFSAILVPLIIRASKAADRGADYLSRLTTLLITFLAIATTLTTLAAPWIISVIGQGYSPAQAAVATQLAYFLLPQIFFYGMYAILGQILNAHESYGPFMWSPVLNNVIALATLVFFMFMFGAEKNGMHHTLENWTFEKSLVIGLGSTLGIVVQAVVLLIPLRKLRLGLRPNFKFRGVGLRHAAKLAGWTAATMIIGNIPFFVYNRVEATVTSYRDTLQDKSHVIAGATALNSASLLYVLPHAVIAVSLATILVNRLSHAAADGDHARLANTLNAGLRTLGLPMILCSAAMITVAGPLGFVFASGVARAGALIGIATIILVFSAPVYSASIFLGRTFYTLNDAKTPFFIALGVAVFAVGMSFTVYLVHPEQRIFAIALVTSAGNALGFLANHFFLVRKLGSYSLRTVFDAWCKFTVAALLASVFGAGLMWLLGGYGEGGFAWSGILQALASCALVTTLMGLIYLGILRIWKTPELNDVLNPLLSRLRR